MGQIQTNFILIIGSYLLTGAVSIIAYMGNRQAIRRDECTKHLEGDLVALRASLEAWKILSTESHERAAQATALVAGKMEPLPTILTDIAHDLKSIVPRLAIIETKINQLERQIDGKWSPKIEQVSQ